MKFGMLINSQDPPDGSNIPRLYEEIIKEAELAEAVGFDSMFVPEHHMMPDGYLPAPAVLLAAVASRTKKLRLGTSILQLPEWHPIHVAEEWCVLDNISRGRAILGAGLGLVEPEFKLFGIELKGAVERFTEQIQIIQKSWREKNFSFTGKYYNLENVTITPRPVQKDGPPLWIGAMSEGALKRAGKLGCGWVTDPLHHINVMKSWGDIYRQSSAEHKNPAVETALLRTAWVAETKHELENVFWPHVRAMHLFYKNLGFFESGRFNTEWEPWVKTITDAEWTFDRVAPNRLIAGNPSQVIDEIARYRDETRCEHMILYLRYPTGPGHEETMKCIRMFGEKVFPKFQ